MASFDDWTFRPAFPDSWISDSHAQESDAFTKALQQSLSSFDSSSPNHSRSETVAISPFNFDFAAPIRNPDAPTPIASSSDPDPTPKPRGKTAATAAVLKVTKRKKPRAASKKSQTTFISADPANFRQMVQQVTGGGANAMVPVMKPEPQRFAGGGRTSGACLPTLDTSAFFLDHIDPSGTPHQHHQQEEMQQNVTVSVASDGGDAADPLSFPHAPMGGGGIDFDSFSSFPTLESWKNI
ncbi:Calmodulin-binding protein 25 [Linum perenne]